MMPFFTKYHPFGESGRLAIPSELTCRGTGRRAEQRSRLASQAIAKRRGSGLDGCEHGGMLGKKGRLMNHIRINI
jgi:hypothetical protein